MRKLSAAEAHIAITSHKSSRLLPFLVGPRSNSMPWLVRGAVCLAHLWLPFEYVFFITCCTHKCAVSNIRHLFWECFWQFCETSKATIVNLSRVVQLIIKLVRISFCKIMTVLENTTKKWMKTKIKCSVSWLIYPIENAQRCFFVCFVLFFWNKEHLFFILCILKQNSSARLT